MNILKMEVLALLRVRPGNNWPLDSATSDTTLPPWQIQYLPTVTVNVGPEKFLAMASCTELPAKHFELLNFCLNDSIVSILMWRDKCGMVWVQLGSASLSDNRMMLVHCALKSLHPWTPVTSVTQLTLWGMMQLVLIPLKIRLIQISAGYFSLFLHTLLLLMWHLHWLRVERQSDNQHNKGIGFILALTFFVIFCLNCQLKCPNKISVTCGFWFCPQSWYMGNLLEDSIWQYQHICLTCNTITWRLGHLIVNLLCFNYVMSSLLYCTFSDNSLWELQCWKPSFIYINIINWQGVCEGSRHWVMWMSGMITTTYQYQDYCICQHFHYLNVLSTKP